MSQNERINIVLLLTPKELEEFKIIIQVLGEDACILSESEYIDDAERKRYVREAMICYKVLRALSDDNLRSEEEFISILRERSGVNIADIEQQFI